MGVSKHDLLTHNGETHTMIEWCKIIGISENGLRYRLDSGMPVDKALGKPVCKHQAERAKVKRVRKRRPDANCINCQYSMKILYDTVFYACDYMGHTGKRRPCEYGDTCTVKKPVEGRKRRIRPTRERV